MVKNKDAKKKALQQVIKLMGKFSAEKVKAKKAPKKKEEVEEPECEE